MTSVLQPWVMELPLREQATLLTGVRGCDLAPKARGADGEILDTPERRLTAWIRWCFIVPADPREVGTAGAFLQNQPPNPFRPSVLGHYPQHWYAHVMHCLEVIGYRHPDPKTMWTAREMYYAMAKNLHLQSEPAYAMITRLSEDRVASGRVAE